MIALYEKLQNLGVFFKYGSVYVFENGSNRILEGKCVER